MKPEHRQTALWILSNSENFIELAPDTVSAVVDASKYRQMPAGETLFRAGDPYDGKVFLLVAGHLSVMRPTGETVNLVPGEFLGLANYLDNTAYHSSAHAAADSAILELPSQALRELEAEHPELFNLFNRIIARQLRSRRAERSISRGALARPVSQIMRTPVASCGTDMSIRGAFQMMQERRIGGLAITNRENKILGILTCAGLSGALILDEANPDDSVMTAACAAPVSVSLDTPVWRAEEIQQQEGVKYIIVCDAGKPVGMVSQSDILRAVISSRATYTSLIKDAESTKELAKIYNNLHEVAAEARESHRRASTAIRFLSETHLAIQRRVVELTLDEMQAKGSGAAPCGYAVLIMGSGGRKEMFLNPDQDNGLIIEDSDKYASKSTQVWFEEFARRFNRNLDRVGYELCPGDIMCRNPLYRKPLSEWKKQISHICKKPTEKAARWSNIMFDFATLYGDDALTTELRRHTLDKLHKYPLLLRRMAEHDAEGRPALGLFNQLVTTTKNEQGEHIDIKRNGLRLISDATRIFALHAGVSVQNTIDRLSALVHQGSLSDDFCATVVEAYEELLELLLSHQISQAEKHKRLDKLIDPDKLTEQTRTSLRMAMRATKRFQDHLQGEFNIGIF